MNTQYAHKIMKTSDLTPYANNSRTHSPEQIKQVIASIDEFGFTNPILIDESGGIIAGHGRVMAAEALHMKEIPCIVLAGFTEAQKKAYVIADNQLATNAGWDMDLLKIEIEGLQTENFDVDLLGFDDEFLKDLLEEPIEEPYGDGVAGSMVANFGQPPFSILDTRKGDWLDRKRWWRALIDDNGESREGTLAGGQKNIVSSMNKGVSLLDPVMAELMVLWFGTEGGKVFDPFAGDTVFGFVAGTLGMSFQGIELRKEQADLNQKRCSEADLDCTYYNDTSENIDKYIDNESIDFVFTCPPYADLEVYSDDPNDLSNMSHDNFFALYTKILSSTYRKLKNNRFAVVVMGEVRNKKGEYIGTIPKTINLMEAAGYTYYNEIILVNGAGTLPLRAGKFMRGTRKIGKMHQNILVFVKGDPKQAADDLGEIKCRTDYDADEEEDENE